jgi:hypothetical protein
VLQFVWCQATYTHNFSGLIVLKSNTIKNTSEPVISLGKIPHFGMNMPEVRVIPHLCFCGFFLRGWGKGYNYQCFTILLTIRITSVAKLLTLNYLPIVAVGWIPASVYETFYIKSYPARLRTVSGSIQVLVCAYGLPSPEKLKRRHITSTVLHSKKKTLCNVEKTLCNVENIQNL